MLEKADEARPSQAKPSQPFRPQAFMRQTFKPAPAVLPIGTGIKLFLLRAETPPTSSTRVASHQLRHASMAIGPLQRHIQCYTLNLLLYLSLTVSLLNLKGTRAHECASASWSTLRARVSSHRGLSGGKNGECCIDRRFTHRTTQKPVLVPRRAYHPCTLTIMQRLSTRRNNFVQDPKRVRRHLQSHQRPLLFSLIRRRKVSAGLSTSPRDSAPCAGPCMKI